MDARLQARITEGVAQPGFVAQRLGGILRSEGGQTDIAARWQHPANRFVRRANGVLYLFQPQFDFHRGIQVIANQQGLAGFVLLGFQLHLVVQALDHAVVEHEHLRAGRSLIAIGHHAVLVDVLVDGQRSGLAAKDQQTAENNQTP